MKPTKQLQQGKGPFELIEEAFHLLRLAPASTLASYYLGSLPFILALLFFWSDMSRSAFAAQRLAASAFGLAWLFFWMKTWQAMFAQDLLARLSGEPAPRWTLGRWVRVALAQSILQSSGVFLLPLAMTILVPFGWTYAFYQNVTVLADGESPDLREVFKRAWRQARLWPLQNHYVLFLLKPFALFVLLNLITGVLAIPFLLMKLLGIETIFSHSLPAMFNTTFFAAIFGLAYLCLDPVLKAIYVLRCFYGESLKTGRDLKAELKRSQSPLALVLVLVLALCGFLNAMRTPTQSEEPTGRGVYGALLVDYPGIQVSSIRIAAFLENPSPRSSRAFQSLGACRVKGTIVGSLEGHEALTVGNSRDSVEIRASLPRLLPFVSLTPGKELNPFVLLAAAESDTPHSALPAPHPITPRSTLAPPELDRSIDEVLHQREFSWRMPRQKVQEKEEKNKGAIATFLESIADTLKGWLKTAAGWMDDLLRWLGKYFRPRPSAGSTGGTGWISTVYLLLWLVVIALVCALVFLIVKIWQGWRESPATLAAEAIVPAPDVADENVGADELPEDGWLKLARELLEKGELRLALRAFYLASLARLAAGDLITIAKFKSNRDYERELQRRAHAFPEVLSTFAQNVSVFDRVWYGLHEVNPDLVADFAGNVQKIKLT